MFVFYLLSLSFSFLPACLARALNSTGTNHPDNPAPFVSDIIECSPIYGDSLEAASCRKALDKIFSGWRPRFLKIVKQKRGTSETTLQVPFLYKDNEGSFRAISPSFSLGIEWSAYYIQNPPENPSCVITIDLAGLPQRDDSVSILSTTLRAIVTSLITQCIEPITWGGFATYGIDSTGEGLFPGPMSTKIGKVIF